MSVMDTEPKVDQKYSRLFVMGIALFSIICFIIMNSRYDSLSRYPYKDQRSRQLIREYLNSEEIEYIIEYSIEPNLFISFIQADGFNIYHAADYKRLSEVLWNEPPQRIVDMIEETYETISTETLIELLQSYSYDDLKTFMSGNDPYGKGSELIMHASSIDAWVDNTHTVSTYTPKYLQALRTEIPSNNTIVVSEEIQDPLYNMCLDINASFKSTQGCGGLQVEQGYISYDKMLEYSNPDENFIPGHNEHQLGLAIDFGVPGVLHDDFHLTEQSQWLQENAWKYGFVRTYTESDVEITGQKASATHYRYVGSELARMIHESGSTFAKYAMIAMK